MDSLIQRFPAEPDDDLMLCLADGVAYQRDMAQGRVSYGDGYFTLVQAYEGSAIANAVNAGRCALLARHLPAGTALLDIGAGTGAFVRAAAAAGYDAKGFDVIPKAAERLRQAGAYAEDASAFNAVTLWDCLEHMEDPAACLQTVALDARAFISLPIFTDLTEIRASKHYRPGEHLYYWTATGFITWMARQGFILLEQSHHEIEAGRDSIGAFAFCKNLPLIPPCSCGGEMQADYFDHPKHAYEWFMRCRRCQTMGPSADNEGRARHLWVESLEQAA